MLAGMGALVFAHHREGFFGNSPHLSYINFLLEIEHGPDVKAADRRMGIPGPRRAVFREYFRETPGVFRKILQPHGAVFNE